MTPLAARVIADAEANLGVREEGGSNTGASVDVYLKFVGLPPGYQWCAAFVAYRIWAAAEKLGLPNPHWPKTGSSSAIYRWAKQTGRLLNHPVPGCVGLVRGGPTGFCHTFLVASVVDGRVHGVDGNEGDRVEHSVRSIYECAYVEIT